MTAPMPANDVYELLEGCVKHLGAAILPLFGVSPEGVCLCQKGAVCNAAGKHPNWKLAPNGVKNATRDLAIIRQWTKTAPSGNWAIRCGEELPDGGFLGVLDCDPRNGSVESLAAITQQRGELPETVTASTGGRGSHRLFRFPHAPASRMVGPGLDLQGGGKYIAISPSRHHTGGVYAWELGLGPGDVPVADAPSWLLDGTGEAQPRPRPDGGTARETVLGEAFALAGWAGAVMTDGMMLARCPQADQHSDNRGRGQDASCVILPPAGGSRFGGFRCQHGHCANLKWQDVIKLLPKEAVEAANRKYPRLGIVPADATAPHDAEHSPNSQRPDPSDRKAERDAMKRKLIWRPDPKTGESKLVNDEVNLSAILTYDPSWKGILYYDEFAQVIRYTRHPEWHPDDAPKDRTLIWQEGHVHCLNLWLRRVWGLQLPAEKIREGVYTVARRDSRNPLRDYLEDLKWDGVKRIDTWLSTYLGVEATPYTSSVGRKWLISAVARALRPGTKVDTLIVLEGPQGEGKSTALRVLAGNPEWFSDTPIQIGEKDAYVSIRGKWIYELAELASLRKADLDKMKAFFSAPTDSYRPPYGREQVTVPRTCVFAGTVNLGEYLNDPTGARRFWPVRIGTIDIESLRNDRDQLWAEAAAVFVDWVKRGEPQSDCLWWPSASERGAFEREQDERAQRHPWSEPVAKWVETPRAKDILAKRGYLMVSDIATYALSIADKDLDSGKAIVIGTIMARDLKYAKRRYSQGKLRVWGYVPHPLDLG